ncbi:cell division protein ZapA [Rhodohalobacter sp. WB101]|jgi:cell division protein ZapA|uniref:Cell division protein ZapA n=2 Tax=Rhodohalobacter sulfatireducens TaxID=2911366 RepID=A0ABS9KGP3_9BACT|nr:cell division protein ZapA [Rhodohalobacter sulfatireducens]MDR9365286.1 cell division protein ZapA [Balneolaceae bacterium]MDR9407535.1 cell division protein ZapA [Balneolaceae bacterium]
MESIKVNILGKQIPLKVEDSEVENTRKIAQYVDEKFKLFRNQFSNQPDSTIMILACLSITEELFELRTELNQSDEKESELMDKINDEISKLIKDIS